MERKSPFSALRQATWLGVIFGLSLSPFGAHGAAQCILDPNGECIDVPPCGLIDQPACSCEGSMNIRLEPNGSDAAIDSLTKLDTKQDNKIRNFGNTSTMRVAGWTNSVGHHWRSLIEFDLPTLPSKAIVTNATLNLFAVKDRTFDPKGNAHSRHTGSNASRLQRIVEDWEEDLVTYNNQPKISIEDEIRVPETGIDTKELNKDFTINISAWIRGFYRDQYPNHGFMMRLDKEPVGNSSSGFEYSSLNFASGDYADASKRPVLSITYSCLSEGEG